MQNQQAQATGKVKIGLLHGEPVHYHDELIYIPTGAKFTVRICNCSRSNGKAVPIHEMPASVLAYPNNYRRP